jgi:hypothetical protein
MTPVERAELNERTTLSAASTGLSCERNRWSVANARPTRRRRGAIPDNIQLELWSFDPDLVRPGLNATPMSEAP